MEKLFSKSHEWVKIEGSKAQIGLSDYAQQELGDIVYVNLPELGSDVECGKAFTDIESVKAVSEELADAPEKINEASDDAWIVEVEMTGREDGLMNAEQYAEFIKTL